MITAFTGKKGSGKTYMTGKLIAQFKTEGITVLCISFADLLKHGIFAGTGKEKTYEGTFHVLFNDYLKTIEQIHGSLQEENKEFVDYITSKYIDKQWTYRQYIQYIGTEVFRGWDADYWAKKLTQRVIQFFKIIPDGTVIIDDLRFISEYQALINLQDEIGIKIKFIHIINPKAHEDNNLHQSETEIDELTNKYEFHKILNYH